MSNSIFRIFMELTSSQLALYCSDVVFAHREYLLLPCYIITSHQSYAVMWLEALALVLLKCINFNLCIFYWSIESFTVKCLLIIQLKVNKWNSSSCQPIDFTYCISPDLLYINSLIPSGNENSLRHLDTVYNCTIIFNVRTLNFFFGFVCLTVWIAY